MGVSDLRLDRDLDSIRNFCDVFLVRIDTNGTGNEGILI